MSTAIIGGADGPTAIFLSSRISAWAIIAGAVAVAAIIFGFYYIIRKK